MCPTVYMQVEPPDSAVLVLHTLIKILSVLEYLDNEYHHKFLLLKNTCTCNRTSSNNHEMYRLAQKYLMFMAINMNRNIC